MKFVVIGAGKLGGTLSEQLVQEGHNVTVIDNNATAIQKMLNSQDLMCIEGNGATASTQIDAGIKKADCLIATTAHDELNMLCCMVARKLGIERSICRVRNPEYFNQIDLIKNDLGLAMVINPELAAAGEIARVLIFPAAAKVEVFGKGKVEVVENRLSEDSPLVGLSLAEIYKKLKLQFLICAVQRDQDIFIPSGDFILRAGDKINVAASHSDLERFFKQNGAIKIKVKNVMIVGGGKIGFYLAKQLCEIGMRVKLIEKDYHRCTELCDLLPKAVIINGDGTDQELLVDEGINDVDAFIALSSIDEENIIMSLFAKNNTKAKIVTKVNRGTYSDMASMLGLETLISPKQLANGMIISYVRSLENASSECRIESLYNIIGNRVEAIEFNVNEKIPGLTGMPLRDLSLKKNILICAIIRKRQVLIPNGNDKLDPGDSVIIVTKEHRFSELKDILE
ncbi:MAG: Trk system potassium transporter TrkA [Ruminococcus sp.]|nr:Trk system potassium transporter TrkA [Ruminococcus sp.]